MHQRGRGRGAPCGGLSPPNSVRSLRTRMPEISYSCYGNGKEPLPRCWRRPHGFLLLPLRAAGAPHTPHPGWPRGLCLRTPATDFPRAENLQCGCEGARGWGWGLMQSRGGGSRSRSSFLLLLLPLLLPEKQPSGCSSIYSNSQHLHRQAPLWI